MPGNDYVEKLLTEISGKLDRILKVLGPEEVMPYVPVYDDDGKEIPYSPGLSATVAKAFSIPKFFSSLECYLIAGQSLTCVDCDEKRCESRTQEYECVKYSRPDLMVDTTELETPSTPPSGLCMSDDGTDLYSCDIDTATIYQHDGEPIRFFSCDCDGCKKPNGQGCLKLTPNDVVYQHVGTQTNTIPPPPAWVEDYNKCAIDCGKQKNELSKVCPCDDFKS